MALFVRRTRSPIVVVAPGPDQPVLELIQTPGTTAVDGVGGGGAGSGVGAAGDGGGAGASTSAETNSTPQLRFTAGAVALFVVGALVGVGLFGTASGPTFAAAQGIGAFALFYVTAQAAERLAELLIPSFEWLPGFGKDAKVALLEQKIAAANNPALRGTPDQRPGGGPKTVEEEAADAQAEVDQARANRTALVFGFTAAVGMVLCGYLEADFLTTVGVTFPDAAGSASPSSVDQVMAIIVTGLIVGGGSKSLHDLISNISKASSSKDTPAETGGQK